MVCDVDRLENYYKTEAWTWELMALVRARVISASPMLSAKLDNLIKSALSRGKLEVNSLRQNVLSMRAKVWKERQPSSFWDIKYAKGGLFDLEFLAQYFQLRYAPEKPAILDPNTSDALEKLGDAKILASRVVQELKISLKLFLTIQSMVRICMSGIFNEDEATIGLRNLLARACDTDDFEMLKKYLLVRQESTHEYFQEFIGDYTIISNT